MIANVFGFFSNAELVKEFVIFGMSLASTGTFIAYIIMNGDC